MTRFRITVRGLGVEIRGYMDQLTDEGAPTVHDLARAMEPFGMVVASPTGDDYDPFGITYPDSPPTQEQSFAVITRMFSESENIVDFMERMAILHLGQASVIRNERHLHETAERELLSRELHHFEVEQENERLRTFIQGMEEAK